MGELRRARALLLVASECMTSQAQTIHELKHPSERYDVEWYCEPIDGAYVCKRTHTIINLDADESYRCRKCKKIYFECLTCWGRRSKNDSRKIKMNFRECCTYCEMLILVCHECAKGIGNLLDEYSCAICVDIVCPNESLASICSRCQIPVRVCPSKHDYVPICQHCRHAELFFPWAVGRLCMCKLSKMIQEWFSFLGTVNVRMRTA
jgi:hypothetical protein